MRRRGGQLLINFIAVGLYHLKALAIRQTSGVRNVNSSNSGLKVSLV